MTKDYMNSHENLDVPQEGTPEGAQIVCITGADPEIHAYAMAKYSRSSLPMRDSLEDISSQRAEEFLETFYFQYGHRSIADLAHLSFSIERLTMLAAIIVVDEQRWDGQERSSRYQDFNKSGYYTPPLGEAEKQRFQALVDSLFTHYQDLSQRSYDHLASVTAKPDSMSPETYRRTVKARAFDVARYLLPLATNTSVGQVVSARTVEQQISRLYDSKYSEVRSIAEGLRQSCILPPFDFRAKQVSAVLSEYADDISPSAKEAIEKVIRPRPTAPTLVKYAKARAFDAESVALATEIYKDLMAGAPVSPSEPVTLVEPPVLEVEMLSTMLYEVGTHPYSQIIETVLVLSQSARAAMIAKISDSRGRHDELRRTYASGYRFQFDILMDVGGFRDMHRHRRCIQILQPLTAVHGFSTPSLIAEMGYEDRYARMMTLSSDLWKDFQHSQHTETPASADYALPLGFKRRSLFKMDFAQVAYICELRTGPAGHFSYRDIAYKMYEEVVRTEPTLSRLIRVTKPHPDDNILKR